MLKHSMTIDKGIQNEGYIIIVVLQLELPFVKKSYYKILFDVFFLKRIYL